MKRTITILGLTILLFIIAAAASGNAQRGPMGPMIMRDYDVKTETTIAGIVEKVLQVKGIHMRGIHLLLKTEKETVEVHLGPADFVEKTMKFEEGDTIQIIGAAVTMMGRPIVIAREVKKGDKVLKLRDEDGMPLWPPPVFFERTSETALRG